MSDLEDRVQRLKEQMTKLAEGGPGGMLRTTGVSFCYNVGRYLAAPGPLLLGYLADMVYGHHGAVLAMRYAGVTMCSFFVVGMLALPFAPETKGKPLPE